MSISIINPDYDSLIVKIEDGENLETLSKKFEISEENLKKINNKTVFSAGDYILIKKTKQNFHVVSPAEDLQSICEKEKVSKQDLFEANETDDLFLFVGKKLLLPTSKEGQDYLNLF